LYGYHAIENGKHSRTNGKPQCQLICHQIVSQSYKQPRC
jgi:hypothetical protein